MIPVSTLQGDHPSCGWPLCAAVLSPTQLVRAQRGHTGAHEPNSSCRGALGWDSCPAELTSIPPLPDLLFLTGLASSVFVVSELIKLCEKRCCPPQHTRGCHNWDCSEIHLEHSCDNPSARLCDPHILPEGTQVQLYQQSLHQRLFYPLHKSCLQKPPEWLLF